MSKEWDQKAIVAALEQRLGIPEGAAAKIAAFNAAQTDWFTTCPKCRKSLSGSIDQLKAHVCGPAT